MVNLKPWFNSNKKFLIFLGAVIVVGGLAYFFQIDAKFSLRKHEGSLKQQVTDQVKVDTASASEIHAECEAKEQPSEKFECYQNEFEVYMKANMPDGGRKTLELLQQLNDMGGYAKVNCHPLSHKVGNIALHVYGNIPDAAPQYLPTCASGFYHGLLEEYLAGAPSYEEGVKSACGDPNKEVYFNWFQCTHGTGHGVMQFRNNELPEALKDCDLLPVERQAREICYGGAFMENITTDEKTGHQAKYIKLDDPLYPCDAKEIGDQYKSSCYFLASSQILKVNGYDMRDAFVQCAKVSDTYRYLCFQSLGRDVSGSTLMGRDKVIEMCQWGKNDEDNGNCIYGAVRDFINEIARFDTAVDLCSNTPGNLKQRCFDGIYLDMSLYKHGQDYIDVCNTMPDPYRKQCASLPH